MPGKLPIARWLFAYQREWLRADVVTGLSASSLVAAPKRKS
jgi:MFS superfamily sulfate permease-like transporter